MRISSASTAYQAPIDHGEVDAEQASSAHASDGKDAELQSPASESDRGASMALVGADLAGKLSAAVKKRVNPSGPRTSGRGNTKDVRGPSSQQRPTSPSRPQGSPSGATTGRSTDGTDTVKTEAKGQLQCKDTESAHRRTIDVEGKAKVNSPIKYLEAPVEFEGKIHYVDETCESAQATRAEAEPAQNQAKQSTRSAGAPVSTAERAEPQPLQHKRASTASKPSSHASTHGSHQAHRPSGSAGTHRTQAHHHNPSPRSVTTDDHKDSAGG